VLLAAVGRSARDPPLAHALLGLDDRCSLTNVFQSPHSTNSPIRFREREKGKERKRKNGEEDDDDDEETTQEKMKRKTPRKKTQEKKKSRRR